MTARVSLRPIRALLNLSLIRRTSDFIVVNSQNKKSHGFDPWPSTSFSMGRLLGLPMASLHLFSDDLGEADRPDPKTVIKVKAKKSTLPSCLHPDAYLPSARLCNQFVPLCQVILFSRSLLLLSFDKRSYPRWKRVSTVSAPNRGIRFTLCVVRNCKCQTLLDCQVLPYFIIDGRMMRQFGLCPAGFIHHVFGIKAAADIFEDKPKSHHDQQRILGCAILIGSVI